MYHRSGRRLRCRFHFRFSYTHAKRNVKHFLRYLAAHRAALISDSLAGASARHQFTLRDRDSNFILNYPVEFRVLTQNRNSKSNHNLYFHLNPNRVPCTTRQFLANIIEYRCSMFGKSWSSATREFETRTSTRQ